MTGDRDAWHNREACVQAQQLDKQPRNAAWGLGVGERGVRETAPPPG